MARARVVERAGITRRQLLVGAGAAALTVGATGCAAAGEAPADGLDLVLYNGRFTTLDDRLPEAQAVGIRGDRIAVVGTTDEVRRRAAAGVRSVDLRGRRVIPGLNDSHTHVIREGLNYTEELSLAGVPSVADALALIGRQVERTPPPQWVRIVGGFGQFQFAEKRLPTLDELNRVSGDTPVLLMHLYERALINAAGMRALGFDTNPPNAPGSEVQRDTAGRPTGMLIAAPNPTILYGTLAKLPAIDPAVQEVSTRLYMRHLNRRGVTSVIDAAGGGQYFPESYGIIQRLHDQGQMTTRIAYSVFPRTLGTELADFRAMVGKLQIGGDNTLRALGAGEILLYSANDFEDFFQARPDLPASVENDLAAVLELFREQRWPFRIHGTYDQSINRFLDIIERVHGPQGPGVRFVIDHAETAAPRTLDRIAALGGGISVQHRMSFQGEEFVARYGAAAAADTPRVRDMVAAGVPLGLGTDATRVASDNLWNALHWLVSGRTAGGLEIYPADRRLSRVEALRHMTQGSAWVSGEETEKGALVAGQLADLAVLSEDYLQVDEAAIPGLTSVLTVMGGAVVHAEGEHADLDPPLPEALPDYSPLRTGTNTL